MQKMKFMKNSCKVPLQVVLHLRWVLRLDGGLRALAGWVRALAEGLLGAANRGTDGALSPLRGAFSSASEGAHRDRRLISSPTLPSHPNQDLQQADSLHTLRCNHCNPQRKTL